MKKITVNGIEKEEEKRLLGDKYQSDCCWKISGILKEDFQVTYDDLGTNDGLLRRGEDFPKKQIFDELHGICPLHDQKVRLHRGTT